VPHVKDPSHDRVQASDYLTGDAFAVCRTSHGWWVTTPVPADLSRYYPPAYRGQRARRFPAPVEWLQGHLYGRRARWIADTVARPGRVLDIGCGPGHLLARFQRQGWDCVGTEMDAEAAEIPRARYGLDIRTGAVERLGLPASSFDAVISWHTLEHMDDPAAALDEIARLLKGGGVALVSVPNFASPEAQAAPSSWFHLDVPRHLTHFPADVLRSQLERRGLTIEAERYSAPEYDVFSLVQTWQNRLGLPSNLLFLMLKRERGRGGRRPTAIERVLAALLLPALVPVALVITSWRAWAGKGAVVTFLARNTRHDTA
jgi:SAM-dependent methyltransferase